MKKWLTTVMAALFLLPLSAQDERAQHVGEIYQQIEKVRTLGSMLYVAAHPDDENTRFIAWCANEKHVESAYISLTRGDGGQNLVGPEKGKLLGVIRTNELLEARKIDRGEQFFSRANDFGYSKTAEETFNIWDRDQVLSDLVWVIRKFKPDVIVTRFPPPHYGYQTHGHHSASAILAREAFDLAADPEAYPGQLEYVEPWKAERLYWNTSTWFYRRNDTEFDPTGKVMIDVGTYNPMLGRSMGEISGMSRSQHKSQGFGAEQTMGSIEEWFEYVAGDSITHDKAGNSRSPAEGIRDKDLFADIDLSWDRLEGGKQVRKWLDMAYERFDPKMPGTIMPLLIKAYDWMENHPDNFWVQRKQEELQKLILLVGGVYAEVNADHSNTTPGDSVNAVARVIGRTEMDILLQSIEAPNGEKITVNEGLSQGAFIERELNWVLSEDQPYTEPYWLRKPMNGIGMYQVDDQQMIGKPENPPALPVRFNFKVEGEVFSITRDIQHNYVDRVEGEVKEPLIIAPPVTANFDSDQLLFSGSSATEQVSITIKSWKADIEGTLHLSAPEGWTLSEEEIPFEMEEQGAEKIVKVDVSAPAGRSEEELNLAMEVNGQTYKSSYVSIDYDHIPKKTLFPKASARLVKLDLEKKNENIGYIMGAGDEVPKYLEQVGYNITMINEDNFNDTDWSRFDAVMVGIRTFNTEDWLFPKWDRVLHYAKEGGNLIVQYQTTWGLKKEDFGPHNLKIGRDRVTVEQAEMRPIDPEHPVLNTPNKLTAADYENWVQERGLYFAESWGKEYQPIFSTNDPGEDPHKGALVITDYGKGKFVYTGIGFFRQLPAGVPGPYRLLANIIALGE